MSKTLLRTTPFLGLLLLSSVSYAGIVHVDANLATGLNDGSSWANAFQGQDGLQTALIGAAVGDQLFVAQGTYRPSSTGARGDSFRPRTGIEIYGGFLGTETSVGERPPIGTAPSIMSADLNGDDNSGGSTAENSYHLIRGNSSDPTAVVDGFTMTGGNANGSGNNNKGGAVLTVGGASPSLRNCLFIDNSCTFGGGAGYISGNAAPSYTDCSFIDNNGGSFGGAFDMAGAGPVRFDRCLFQGNRAARAGAVEVFSTTGVVISNCVFTDNLATGGSGGGALWMGSGGNTEVRNCTVYANRSTNQAAAGMRVQSAAGTTVANCIFWDNEGPGGAQGASNQISGTSNVTYTIVEGGFAGTGNLAADPQLTNPAGGDFSSTITSPGVDAGNNAAVPSGVTLDIAGSPRFVDEVSVPDTGSGSSPLVDMGAAEFQGIGGDFFSAYCPGDGTGGACPCGNNGAAGNGCANGSFASGSNLSATGTPSIASDTMVLNATGSTPSSPGIFFQGDDIVAGGNGLTFGDGLRCAGGVVCRMELVFADTFGAASSTVSVSVKCGANAGETKRYQWWFRDTNLTLCGGGFNVSNGLETTWMP
ncbi:MAG: hypothetical protein ACI8X5_003744 [Planctomycetota bacterium]|jgi:hypothetical protein